MIDSLANAEMYLALARIFASFDLSLYKTNREDDIDIAIRGLREICSATGRSPVDSMGQKSLKQCGPEGV